MKRIHLEGVYPYYDEESSKLRCLERSAKWIVKGFREQGRVVDVYLHKRNTTFVGRTVGTKVVFDDL